ncbi:MAG: Secondary metabolism regulator lae1, partial [Candelina mexicana]
MEQVEIDFQPRCNDNTLPDFPLVTWYNWLADATHRAARPIAYNHDTRHMLQSQGFVDIVEEVIQVPYNTWPTTRPQKDNGRWYNLGMTEGLEAMSLAPFSRLYHWPEENIKQLVAEVSSEICNRNVHAYNN